MGIEVKEVREVPIRTLKPGQRVRLHLDLTHRTVDATLLEIGSCTVIVLPDSTKQSHTFNTNDGSEVTFNERFKPSHWQPETPVEVLNEPQVAAEAVAEALQRFYRPGSLSVSLGKGENDMATAVATRKAAKLPGTSGRSNGSKAKAVAKPENDCWCGCGKKVHNQFAMGHDGRFYGWCKKIVAGTLKFTEIPAEARSHIRTVENAKALLKASGH